MKPHSYHTGQRSSPPVTPSVYMGRLGQRFLCIEMLELLAMQ